MKRSSCRTLFVTLLLHFCARLNMSLASRAASLASHTLAQHRSRRRRQRHTASTTTALLRHASDVDVALEAAAGSRDVVLTLTLPRDVPRQSVRVTIFKTSMRVSVDGMDGIALEGDFPHAVDVDGCFWDKDDATVRVTLEKLNRTDDWGLTLERDLPAPGDTTVTTKCFFDVAINGKRAGRIIFGLFGSHVPRTVENFRALCTGEKGVSALSGKPLTYKGNCFHRIVKGLALQGGDFTLQNGQGGESVYGLTFEDEAFGIPHDAPGTLSMANRGPNTNGSQFIITKVPTPGLDGKNVVFGRVIEGMDVVDACDAVGTEGGGPLGQVSIIDCGTLPLQD